MKNKIFVCLTVFFSAAIIKTSAQDADSSKLFIGVHGSYAIPFGAITEHEDYLDLNSGFAKGGGAFMLDGGYFISKNIGIGAVLSMGSYGYNDPDTILSKGYVEAFAVGEVTMTVGHYKTFNFLPALYYTVPMNKLNVDFRLMAGYSGLTTPEIKVQLEHNAEQPLIQKASSGGGLGFGAGAGMRYAFSKHVGLALRIDYLHSKPKVAITYTNLNNPTDKFRLMKEYNVGIGSLNTSLGLAFTF